MSANPNRRGLLGLFAAAPLVAAGGQPRSALAQFRFLSATGRLDGYAASVMGKVQGVMTGEGIAGIGAALERATPLDTATPPELERLAGRLDEPRPTPRESELAEIRAIAALAIIFPPEIAAYRSFAPHLRRRLYADMLLRRARLLTLAEPPTHVSPPPDRGA